MQSTFADQLAGLDLAGFTIGPPPVTSTDYPSSDAITHTLVRLLSLPAVVTAFKPTRMPRPLPATCGLLSTRFMAGCLTWF